jgi:hypothetical protein
LCYLENRFVDKAKAAHHIEFIVYNCGTFVLTMFKKSYFLEWGSPPLTVFMAVPLTSQHPLEKAHVVASSSSPIANNIQDSGGYKHKIVS